MSKSPPSQKIISVDQKLLGQAVSFTGAGGRGWGEVGIRFLTEQILLPELNRTSERLFSAPIFPSL